MDVQARSIHAASLDVTTDELARRRFNSGAVEPVVEWLAALPGPVRACYEAGRLGLVFTGRPGRRGSPVR